MTIEWKGVMPAITTSFDKDLNIDLFQQGPTAIEPGSRSRTPSARRRARSWSSCRRRGPCPLRAFVVSLQPPLDFDQVRLPRLSKATPVHRG